MNNLTKIAALPGSGGGCMSALPAEKNEAPEVWLDAAGNDVTEDLRKDLYPVEVITVWPTLEAFKATVQMKALYFDEMAFPPIDQEAAC